MDNILGCNSDDSYIHTLSARSVFVFKLLFSPNGVYISHVEGGESLTASLETAARAAAAAGRVFHRDSWKTLTFFTFFIQTGNTISWTSAK